MHKRAQRSKSIIDKERHAAARRLAKAEWKKCKFNYYFDLNEKLLNKNTSSKTWWKLCKQELGISKKSLIPPLIVDGEIITDDVLKCEALNNYFALQCTKIVPPTSASFLAIEKTKLLSSSAVPILDDVVVNQTDIINVTNSVNINKSSGTDSVSNLILKKCGVQLSVPLSILFNSSLSDACFPSAWKKADVYPVHKKGDPLVCSNYRPISFLSSTSKLLERLVFNQLYEFCQANNLLTSKNSGFKK